MARSNILLDRDRRTAKIAVSCPLIKSIRCSLHSPALFFDLPLPGKKANLFHVSAGRGAVQGCCATPGCPYVAVRTPTVADCKSGPHWCTCRKAWLHFWRLQGKASRPQARQASKVPRCLRRGTPMYMAPVRPQNTQEGGSQGPAAPGSHITMHV